MKTGELIFKDGEILEFCGVFVAKESVYLLDDFQLIQILRRQGVDLSRKTFISDNGAVYYKN